MELIVRVLLLGVLLVAAVLLFTPYESILEAFLALAIVAAVVLGFLLHPRRDVFYVRTTIRLSNPDRNQMVEHDHLAVRVQVVRLWALFLPTLLAVAFLVIPSANGTLWRFSFLNWIFSGKYAYVAIYIWHTPPLIVLVLLSTWISERWVMRDAEACTARSFSISGRSEREFPVPSSVSVLPLRRVSYLFMGERGEYYGGDCLYFGLVRPLELATIVFHNVRKPELNRIAMGLLFHQLIVVARGVTDLDKQTVAAKAILAGTAS